jgi:hypothetical protein
MNDYCVILCCNDLVNSACYPRTKRFYIGAPTADRAILVASDENPEFRVLGIEHSDLYPRLPRNHRSPSVGQAA